MLKVGILGGMGPMATVDLFKKIVECTPASCDQEHLKIIVYNNPQIPSRIEAIMSGAQSPEQELIKSALFLEECGADILVMPCNTAHFWHRNIQDRLKIKLINMIENAAEYVSSQSKLSAQNLPVLLASVATIKTELYQKVFSNKGIRLITVEPEEQKIISGAIDEAKAGLLEENPFLPAMRELMHKYRQQGATSFIAGCTEIPLLFNYIYEDYVKIDPTKLLAQEVVRQAIS